MGAIQKAQKPPPRVLPFPQPAAWLWKAAAATAAAAAALFLFVRTPAPLPALPAYTAHLSVGAQSSRGTAEPSSGLPVFIPGTRLTLDLRPEQAVAESVEAQAFLARGADIFLWKPEPPLDLPPGGAVRLQGRLGEEIRLQPGEWRIWIVVGRPGKIPPADKIVAELRAGRTRHADWHAVVSENLRVADRASP